MAAVPGGLADPSAADAASCSGWSCAGKDPSAAGCTGNETIGWHWNIEFRVSSTCDAAWARYKNPSADDVRDSGTMYCIYSTNYSKQWLDTRNIPAGKYYGIVQQECIQVSLGLWTKMVTGKYLRICEQPVNVANPPRSGSGCSKYNQIKTNPYA
ncbi:MAG: hypothetical protein AAF547_14850 [Actinomycetota bacterium]